MRKPFATVSRLGSAVHQGYRSVGRASGWLLGQVAPGVYVNWTKDGISFNLPLLGLITGLSSLAAFLLISWVYVLFLITLVRFEYFGPLTNVEETAYSWNIGRNFARYGFMQTLFLQDVGHSPEAADHPYTYNHQPPGLDVITGAILSVFPENFRIVRFLFSLIFIIGLFAYFSFANVILRAYGLPLAGLTFLFINVGIILQSIDKQTAYIQPLMIFGPWWLYTRALRGSRASAIAAMLLTLVASFTLDYVALAAVMWGWLLLALTQVLPITLRQAALFVSIAILGIVLHLVQNLLYLGWPIFIQELSITIGNRMVGYPSMEQVRDFYEQIGVVHHGSHPPDPSVLIRQIIRQIDFSLSLTSHLAWLLVTLGALTVATLTFPHLRWVGHTNSILLQRGPWLEKVGLLMRLWIWIFGVIILPHLMFPAYTQEVALIGSGVPLYFQAVGALALIMTAVHCVLSASSWSRPWMSEARVWGQSMCDAWLSRSSSRDHRFWTSWFSLGLLFALIVLAALPVLAVLSIRTSIVPREARLAVYAVSFVLFILLMLQLIPRLIRVKYVLRGVKRADAQPDGDESLALRRPTVLVFGLPGDARRVASSAFSITHRIIVSALTIMVLSQATTLRLNEMDRLSQTIATSKYARLADLQAFSGELFMTNINSPLVGFFTQAPGYGVCDFGALASDMGVDSQACLIDFQRRHAYWANQAPRYFFFFRAPELFPGFGTCLPNQTLQVVTRGGDDCISQLHRRLSNRAEKVFDNELVEVFDLSKQPSDAQRRTTRLASPRVSVAGTYPNAIVLSWEPVEDATTYIVEAKQSPAAEFRLVGTANRREQGLLVTDLGAVHRTFFRVAACARNACSPYTYIEGRTDPT